MSNAPPQPGCFQHEPLDHSKPSIRFIKVLPQLTADGRIRCEVSHTTIGSETVYRCLSYQWGEPNAATSREIEINGASFTVRKNLHDFLRILWSNFGYNTILGTWAAGVWWIDALCIDQQNTLERNHQVGHMGTIYSEAEEVVVWLGLATAAKNKVRNLLDLAPSGGGPSETGSTERGGTYLHDRRIVGRRIIRNEYWNRAWITQEIALAQSVSVLVDDLLYGFPELVDLLSLLDIPWRHTHFDQFVGIRSGTIDLSNRSLVDLLDHFQNRKCTLPQDRVFSLLSLCSNVDGSIRVDYNMSKDLLANQIMKSTMNSRTSPRESCFCSATIVARSLGMDLESETHDGILSKAARTHSGIYLEFEIADLSIQPLTYENGHAGSREYRIFVNDSRNIISANVLPNGSPMGQRISRIQESTGSSGLTNTGPMCETLGLAKVKQALCDNTRLAIHHSERWHDWRAFNTRRREVELSRIMKSFIRESQQFATSATGSGIEIAPGFSVDVLDQKANICLVQIAFQALPDLFYDVTSLCDDNGHLAYEDQGSLRHLRVVYAPPKSNV
ncbi:hypothetical protein IQ06DRAFT_353681 [Phaeosphaeriaceae sp. SRC1lsM3a]|nr:hypothetical protein IQ06DRAFT_353681 [Stagonospora sp. SRC1lsM3a]